MKKLFTLGCSLTWNMGWKEYVADRMNYELVNSAMFGGSNNLQMRRLNSYIVNSQIGKDDVIIWQITSQLRHSFCVNGDPSWDERLDDYVSEDADAKYYMDSPVNYFDAHPHTDVLSCHPLIIPASEYYNANSTLEGLISTMILLNNTYKILIFVGWQGALDNDTDNYDLVIDLLEKNKVPHINESYVSWAIRNNHPLAEDLHPTMDTSELYGEMVLFPELERLGWI